MFKITTSNWIAINRPPFTRKMPLGWKINGAIKVNSRGHYLNYAILPERPKKQINIALPALAKRKQSGWKPPINHPWRRSLAGNIQQKQTTFIN